MGLEFTLEAVSNVGLMMIRMIKQQPLLLKISLMGSEGWMFYHHKFMHFANGCLKGTQYGGFSSPLPFFYWVLCVKEV